MSAGHCVGYFFKIGNLIVLQEYEFDTSSSVVEENLRNRSGPLIEMQVLVDVD